MWCEGGFASCGLKCTLVLMLVMWSMYATVLLVSLTTTGHCPIARSVIPVLPNSSKPPGTDFRNIATEHNTTTSLWQDPVEERESLDSIHQRYASQLGKNTTGGCTMVMLTYKRENILPKVLLHYCKRTFLQRILVIWNDVNTTIPKDFLDLKFSCKTDLKFIVSKENLLTNRYIPRKEIETDCVCLMDDDRMISGVDMEFGYDTWRNIKHRIVGFEERSFIKKNDEYIYTMYERRRFFSVQSEKSHSRGHLPPGYNIEVKDGVRILHVKNKTFILGKTTSKGSTTIMRQSEYSSEKKSEGYNIMLNSCFIHRMYLEMYSDPAIVSPKLLDYVNEQRNCEDILMSVVVTKFLTDIHKPQCGVLAVKAGWITNLEEEAHEQGDREGLSFREDHYKARSACLQKFAAEYGYLPLHSSKIVMSKVLYRS